MTLLRSKSVVSAIVTFDDGTEERWTFPEGCAHYKENSNMTTERDPKKLKWIEHTLYWVSDKIQFEKRGQMG